MSKPYFLARPSGLFCRFLVPSDLRSVIGTRFIVRKLNTSDQGRARLIAAILSLAFREVFSRLRHGEKLDIKKILAQIDERAVTHWEAKRVTLPSGAIFEGLKITDDADQARFNSLFSIESAGTPLVTAKDKGGLLSDRVELFLSERKKGELSEKNLADAAFALKTVMLALIGNKPLNEVDSDDADTVMAALLQWPSNASKKSEFRGLNVFEILAKAKTLDFKPLGPRTVEKYLDRLRAFFNWCDQRAYLKNKNPFAQRRLMTKDKRSQTQKKPFNSTELEALFDADLRRTCNEPHKFWVPLIAIFSGARLNEIAQLYVEDIYQSGEIWLFKIIADKSDKKIKNRASERAVPVHAKLLELGFLDYVRDVEAHGFQRLFPNLPHSSKNGFGDSVGDWFNGRYLRPASPGSKVPRAGISDPEKTFHSFRYVVINRLYAITRERLLVAEITGHERGDDVLTNVYLDPTDAQRRAACLDQLGYDFLEFEPYRKGQYDGFFRRLTRKIKQ